MSAVTYSTNKGNHIFVRTFRTLYHSVKPLLLNGILCIIGLVGTSSCSGDEEEIDLRNQLAGEYVYTKTVYSTAGIFTETGAMNIVRDDSNDENLLVFEEENFYGSTLNAIDSSLLFFIPQQDIKDEDGSDYVIKGVNNVSIGNYKGDAGYYPNKRRLQLYYKVEYENQPVANYSVSILAERKEQ